MNDIRFQYITPKEIELKYSNVEFPLVYEYLGVNRSHGDSYYDLNWYEIIYNYNVAGLICLDLNRSKEGIHLSVFEILEKNKGIGTKTIDFLVDFGRSLKKSCITLQAQNPNARRFYLRLGFINKIIDDCPYLIKYL